MIFNKNSNGADELRVLTGSYWKSNDFEKISIKVELASEDVANLIGTAVMQRANSHYNSSNYLASDEGLTPEQKAENSLNDNLVKHIQLPVAFLATMWHYQSNDVSHEDTGRKVKIDESTEKLAWEWMYNRDDAMALQQYHRTLDRLIRFLNANQDSIEEWKDSAAQKNILSLFIRTVEHFNRIFPIDNSPGFFLRISPFMREVERKYIKTIFGQTKFDQLKSDYDDGSISEEDLELVDYACDAIALLTMSIAVKRLSVQILPEGVVQQYFAAAPGLKSSQPATIETINNVSASLNKDGNYALNELKKAYSATIVDDSDEDITDMLPRSETTDNFIAL